MSTHTRTATQHTIRWALLLVVVVGLAVGLATCHDGDDEHDRMHEIQMTTPTPEVQKKLLELSRPSSSRSTRFRFEWVDEPEMSRGFGETKLITNCINTGDHPTEQTISTNFAHTFELDEADELEVEEFLLETARNHSVSITSRAGVRSLIHDKVMLEKRTKGTVLFRDNVIKFSGLVRKVFNSSTCDQHLKDHKHNHNHHQHHETPEQCKKRLAAKSQQFYLALKATETDPDTGKALGTFTTEYFGTDKYKHPDFYNLPNRIIRFNRASPSEAVEVIEGEVLSPYACADQVNLKNRTIGLYQVNKMRCTVADPEVLDPASSLLDRDGRLIGHFDYNTKLQLDTTSNSTKFQEWKKQRTCDIILAANQRWHCKKFQEKPSNVVMFRRIRSSAVEKQTMELAGSLSTTTSTTSTTAVPK